MSNWPLLSLLIWLPVLGGIFVLLVGNDEKPFLARFSALMIASVCVALCVPLYLGFDQSSYAYQFREHLEWIPSFRIFYDLGVDGISMPLVVLTVYTSFLVILAAWKMIKTRVALYLATFLIMQGMMVGVFAALDGLLFYFFWEGTLIPMYLSIGIWGSANRSYAAIKFFLFTFFGSALMLATLLYLRVKAGSFYLPDLYQLPLAIEPQILIFVTFLLAFAVKIPMFPFHTWLPDAHTEAPAGGSVILAALMLKMGGYGFLRFSLPITPDASQYLAWPMIILSLIAIVYIGLIAMSQTDMKRLIAYSSVAHMGFVTLGTFMIYILIAKSGNTQDSTAYTGMEGGMVQMISHGFSSGALFLAFGMLYERMHTRRIKDFGGIAKTMPIFAAFFMLFAMSNVGLPGTSGFVGEFMVILSSFKANFWVAFLAGLSLIIGAAYTLWMYKRVFFGPVVNKEVAELKDSNCLEIFVFILLAAAILFIGFWPKPLLDVFQPSVGHLLDLSLQSKL